MGGFPSKGTPKDKRLKRNWPKPTSQTDAPPGERSIFMPKPKQSKQKKG